MSGHPRWLDRVCERKDRSKGEEGEVVTGHRGKGRKKWGREKSLEVLKMKRVRDRVEEAFVLKSITSLSPSSISQDCEPGKNLTCSSGLPKLLPPSEASQQSFSFFPRGVRKRNLVAPNEYFY